MKCNHDEVQQDLRRFADALEAHEAESQSSALNDYYSTIFNEQRKQIEWLKKTISNLDILITTLEEISLGKLSSENIKFIAAQSLIKFKANHPVTNQDNEDRIIAPWFYKPTVSNPLPNQKGDMEWTKEKPEFTKDCLLLTCQVWTNKEPEYMLFEIKKSEGYNDKEEPIWYWGIFCMDGEEWGELSDLSANYYKVLQPFSKPLKANDVKEGEK